MIYVISEVFTFLKLIDYLDLFTSSQLFSSTVIQGGMGKVVTFKSTKPKRKKKNKKQPYHITPLFKSNDSCFAYYLYKQKHIFCSLIS